MKFFINFLSEIFYNFQKIYTYIIIHLKICKQDLHILNEYFLICINLISKIVLNY